MAPVERYECVRSLHPYGFRSGEWGRVLGRFEEATTGRVCMLVQFEDGATDTWPVEDASDERESDKSPD